MKLFGPLYDRVLVWSRHPKAPWYLGAVSFAESSFFLIPPDVMLAPMALAKPHNWFRLAMLTTVTSVLGGLFGYLIGWVAMDAVMPWIERAGYASKLAHAGRWFEQWGFWAVLLAGFSPIPYKAFTITAGGLGMALLPFTLASFIGRGGRFFLVAFLMARFGPAVEAKLKPTIEWLGWGMVALAVVAYLVLR
ncbi:MAG: YqaA family protein [Hydrogenophaga sp.]|jgi:membrane protein YqaA with SNARE-associated domain|uniref:YqaA family protein n=1 Tax=Hydrogenophaga sp. TaxID=1904254 RepID=UPI00271A078B|nr:YqaA family protein [Hydrogenophaga sp.]MDO9148400.1 YqaA family protein [Hydrogenophaga sp.]MDO9605141.1 YqaA family protein [Hydrogenophaga sp.]MDP2165246.1 YqaA family protein [Hydrogenophaga sp.]MDP3477211.1 YqaA family protein [Hydrogenophaga sp.]